MEVMFTTAPPPVSAISGAAACVIRKGPVRFTASTRFHSSAVVSRMGLNTAVPALFTNASSRPKRSRTAAAADAPVAGSATSAGMASVASGRAIAAMAASSSAASMSSSATRHPSARKRRVAARPMPRPAPVTSATREACMVAVGVIVGSGGGRP